MTLRYLLSQKQKILSWVQKLHVLVDKVDQLYVFQRTPNWFFPRIEGNFPQWYKNLLRMFPFLMTLNFWAMFALIEVQSLLWMRKGWTERYNVHVTVRPRDTGPQAARTLTMQFLNRVQKI